MNVGKRLKQLRDDNKRTQQQMAFDFNVSRESFSAYETERAKLPADIAQQLTNEFNDPFVALEAVAEYYGWGIGKLDGQAVDLHRASVKAKTEEELEEALEAIKKVCLSNNPSFMEAHQRDELKRALMEAIDAIVALKHFVAVICKEYGFSWIKLWAEHKVKLIARKYKKADRKNVA
ncbi:helix-turn-helix transcriptional regulator [Bacillus tianshenii]|nr:helix-turn-helix transcriptional regulator [Bacillus tianshenii]